MNTAYVLIHTQINNFYKKKTITKKSIYCGRREQTMEK